MNLYVSAWQSTAMESFVLLVKTARIARTFEHPNHPRRRHSRIGFKGPMALKKKYESRSRTPPNSGAGLWGVSGCHKANPYTYHAAICHLASRWGFAKMSKDFKAKRSLMKFSRQWTEATLCQWREAAEIMGIGGSIEIDVLEEFKGTVDVLFDNSKPRLAYGSSGQRVWKKTTKDCSKFSNEGYWLTLVTSGSELFEQRGRRQLVSSGSCYLCATHLPFYSKVSADFQCKTIYLPGSLIRKLLVAPEDLTAICFSKDTAWGKALVSCIQALDERSLDETVIPSSLMIEQIGSLLALAIEKPIVDSTPYKLGILNRLIAISREHSSDAEFSPHTLSELAGVSVRHIHGIFACAGTTFGKTLQDIRMSNALAMLNSEAFKRKQISEISLLSGYKSVSHFIRHFREHNNLPPAAYRRNRLGIKESEE